ncbi:MAG TPA: rhodanese-like domain-containing protein [bacterium]|nr:rhodanese-like domain-containing protein [bacterium]
MRTKPTKGVSSPSFPQALAGSWKGAAVLFLAASAFGVFFNAFYADGIELKVQPRKASPPPDSHAPVTYAGLGTSPTHPSSTRDVPRPSSIPRLSLQGTFARFQKGTAVFLDARKPEEYQEGHIPGALNFYGNELDLFAPRVMPQLPDKAKEIVAYCHGGDCDLSLQVAETLRAQGYTNVKVFQDGWPAWTKAGYPAKQGEDP